MKKLIFTAITMLFCQYIAHAQVPFINDYSQFFTSINGVVGETKDLSISVVFNEKDTNNIIIYGLEEIKRFHVISIEEGKTDDGSKYQLMNCIEIARGEERLIQLFDEALRIFIKEDYIEYH